MNEVRKNQRFHAPAQDQFMCLARSLHDGQARCVLTFAEPIDADRMSRAIRLSLDIEPVLGCRFVPHAWKPFWRLRDDLDQISACPVSPSRDIESDGWKFLAEPIDPEKDPQIQLKLFRAQQDVLCLKINHMVTDGGGMLEYVQLLGRTFQELGKNSEYRPAYLGSSSRGQGQVFRHAGIRRMMRGCLSNRLPVTAWGFPTTGTDYSGRTFAVRRLQASQFDALKAYGRLHRVSLNLVLHTAFYRALFELLDPPLSRDLPIQATINLRYYLPSGRATRICNLAGVFFPALTRLAQEPFEATLKRVRAVFETAKAEQPWLGAALGVQSGFTFGFTAADYIGQYFRRRVAAPGKMHPFFANFGQIGPEMIDFGQAQVTDLIMLGPIPFPPASILSVHSFNGVMMITTGYCHTAIDPKVMDRFLDLFVAELPG